jgi:hypothetical protein
MSIAPRQCNCCDRGDDDLDPLVRAHVGQASFWICRSCVADWLRAEWPEVYRRGGQHEQAA